MLSTPNIHTFLDLFTLKNVNHGASHTRANMLGLLRTLLRSAPVEARNFPTHVHKQVGIFSREPIFWIATNSRCSPHRHRQTITNWC